LYVVPEPRRASSARTLGAVDLVPGRVRVAVLTLAGRVLERAEVTSDAGGGPGPADVRVGVHR
jgi:glucokinase